MFADYNYNKDSERISNEKIKQKSTLDFAMGKAKSKIDAIQDYPLKKNS